MKEETVIYGVDKSELKSCYRTNSGRDITVGLIQVDATERPSNDQDIAKTDPEEGLAHFNNTRPLQTTASMTSPTSTNPTPEDTTDAVGESSSNSSMPLCQQPMDQGPCRASFPMWHYDATSGTCQPLLYGGCQGNDNRFWTERQCLATCPDEVPCPEHAASVCRVSESLCANASCPGYDLASCHVTPCTCEVYFLDDDGEKVQTCGEAPGGRAGDGADDGDDDGGEEEGECDDEKRCGADLWVLAWVGAAVGIAAVLTIPLGIASYKCWGNSRSYPIMFFASREEASLCEEAPYKFTEYSTIKA